jgi:hypothetical protein
MPLFKDFLAKWRRSPAQKLIDKQLAHAQKMALEHQAAADYHQAMADMYRGQQLRLNSAVRIECTAADFLALYNSRGAITDKPSGTAEAFVTAAEARCGLGAA